MPNERNWDIAVVGSPSTNTELTIDLLQEAVEERLVGALVAFKTTQGGAPLVSVGQVVGIELRRSEEHTSELQSLAYLVCRLLLEKKKVFYYDGYNRRSGR